jgi:hypothetical protein
MKAISYTFAYCGIIFRPLRDIQLKCNEQWLGKARIYSFFLDGTGVW